MLLVISDPNFITDEHIVINSLFDDGLEIFHLRKPSSDLKEVELLLKQIDKKNHSKIALHQHHELSEEFELGRLHYPEEKRKTMSVLPTEKIKSTSIHDLNEYEELKNDFEYCFFGPVFNSISKPGHKGVVKDNFQLPKVRTAKIIALGGIDETNIEKIKEYKFDGIALLGAIWNEPENAMTNFKRIKTKWQQ